MIKRLAIILVLMLFSALSLLPVAHSSGNLRYCTWPMYRHDLKHTGYTLSPAPSVANVKWRVETGGDVCSSAAVAYGKLYIGAGCSIQRNVLCLNPWTGAVNWNQTVAGNICSSPAIKYGRVYIGTNYQDWDPVHPDLSRNPYGNMGVGGVCCLDARTGRICWSYVVGQYGCPDLVGQYFVISSPAVVGGRVYIGSGDSHVYCLNAFTGSLIWNYPTNDAVDSSPAVYRGKVYVGSIDESVYCLDACTGDLIWSKELNGPVWCSPTVVNGKVYVGNMGDGIVYCLDANTGDLIWSYSAGSIGSIMSSPAVACGNVYIGTESPDGSLYCLDANTGSFKWEYDTEGDIHHSSPAVAQGKVYIGSWHADLGDPGYTHCVNAYTGDLIWRYTSAPDGYHSSSPTVAYCMVFTAADNFIYGFSGSTAEVKVNTQIDFTLNPNPAHPGQRVELSGTLQDASANPLYPARVKVKYSTDGGGSWGTYRTLYTNVAGEFSRTFTAPRAGTYLLKVIYAGSVSFNPSSHTETLTVTP